MDFSPARQIVLGRLQLFPPASVQPSSVGDEYNNPLIQLTNAGYVVWNAPTIGSNVDADYLNQFCDGLPTN